MLKLATKTCQFENKEVLTSCLANPKVLAALLEDMNGRPHSWTAAEQVAMKHNLGICTCEPASLALRRLVRRPLYDRPMLNRKKTMKETEYSM